MNEPEAEDLYEMANLYPKHTGLPMVIWVSERGHARHDARVKVSTKHGTRMNINDTAVVGNGPLLQLGWSGRLLIARLSGIRLERRFRSLLTGTIDTVELVQQLKRLPTP